MLMILRPRYLWTAPSLPTAYILRCTQPALKSLSTTRHNFVKTQSQQSTSQPESIIQPEASNLDSEVQTATGLPVSTNIHSKPCSKDTPFSSSKISKLDTHPWPSQLSISVANDQAIETALGEPDKILSSEKLSARSESNRLNQNSQASYQGGSASSPTGFNPTDISSGMNSDKAERSAQVPETSSDSQPGKKNKGKNYLTPRQKRKQKGREAKEKEQQERQQFKHQRRGPPPGYYSNFQQDVPDAPPYSHGGQGGQCPPYHAAAQNQNHAAFPPTSNQPQAPFGSSLLPTPTFNNQYHTHHSYNGNEPWRNEPWRRDHHPEQTPEPPNVRGSSNGKSEPSPRGPFPPSTDLRARPSSKSSGVPNPTPAYYLRASFLPLPSPTIRPLLVVIDLNGTLLFRPRHKNAYSFVERPHACEFIKYCIDTFSVVIWSSARPENVSKMCNQLFSPHQASKVVATWGRNRFGLSQDDYNKKVQVYKRLTLLWDDPLIQASHPNAGQGEKWNQGNTVLVDDSIEKARSEPFNAITIPEFAGDMEKDQDVLPLVHDYINKLAMVTDVSTYIRAHPFSIENARRLAAEAAEAAEAALETSQAAQPERQTETTGGKQKQDIKDEDQDTAEQGEVLDHDRIRGYKT